MCDSLRVDFDRFERFFDVKLNDSDNPFQNIFVKALVQKDIAFDLMFIPRLASMIGDVSSLMMIILLSSEM